MAEALHRWGRRDLVEMLCTRFYKYDKLSKEWRSHIRDFWTPKQSAAAEAEHMPEYKPSPSPEPSDDDNQVADCKSEQTKLEGVEPKCEPYTEQTPTTAEYRTFLQHIQDIELVIRSLIVTIGGELLSSELIMPSQHEEIRNNNHLSRAPLIWSDASKRKYNRILTIITPSLMF